LPHFPAVHDSEQHWLNCVHAAPVWTHWAIEPPHFAFMQSWPQQSPLAAHALPSALQTGGAGVPHAPFVQVLLQQSLAATQLCPLPLQTEDWHVPPWQSWLQHAALALQLCPCAVHMGWAHTPPVHAPLQQLAALWHD
jgi:hypothetical protein